jgi:16S rRNA (guanine527-N7)-methyltransferase
MSDGSFGPDDFEQATNVSRETMQRLKLLVSLLEEWNRRHNLVSRASLAGVWRRHVLDSAQLIEFVPPAAKTLVDLGSGAGFPGLVLAVLLRDRPGFQCVLWEATRRKCDFLAEAAERIGVDTKVRNGRLEDAPPEIFDLVTARACAPLPRLLLYAKRFQGPHTRNVFLKGQNVGPELTEAHKSWNMQVGKHPSRSDPSGTVLVIEDLGHAG